MKCGAPAIRKKRGPAKQPKGDKEALKAKAQKVVKRSGIITKTREEHKSMYTVSDNWLLLDFMAGFFEGVY